MLNNCVTCFTLSFRADRIHGKRCTLILENSLTHTCVCICTHSVYALTKQLDFKSIVKWKVRYASATISKFCVAVRRPVSVHSKHKALLRFEVPDCYKKKFFSQLRKKLRLISMRLGHHRSFIVLLRDCIICKICDRSNSTLSVLGSGK